MSACLQRYHENFIANQNGGPETHRRIRARKLEGGGPLHEDKAAKVNASKYYEVEKDSLLIAILSTPPVAKKKLPSPSCPLLSL